MAAAKPESSCAQRPPPSWAAVAPVRTIKTEPHSAGSTRIECTESPNTYFHTESNQIENGGWST